MLLAGCASGSITKLPEVGDPAGAATVVVIRPSGFIGGARAIPVMLDGVEVGSGRACDLPGCGR